MSARSVVWETSAALQAIADRETAELRNRAAQAELALLKVRQEAADRSLSPEQQKSLSASLAEFAGQPAEIIVFPVSFEHHWIASQIYGVLLNARWKVSPVRMAAVPPDCMLIQTMLIRATADEQSQMAARSLFEALKDTPARGGFTDGPLSDPARPRVEIYVGDKPAALSSWVQP